MREKQINISVNNQYGKIKWAEWPQPVYGRPREAALLAEGVYWARDPEPVPIRHGAVEALPQWIDQLHVDGNPQVGPQVFVNYRPAELNPNPF